MRSNPVTSSLFRSLVASVLVAASGAASAAQTTVNLTAGPATATLPDGSGVPMWGYSCDAGQLPSVCAPLAAVAPGGWSPVVITVPAGNDLVVNLTNELSFQPPTPPGATTPPPPNAIPTSLVIVGQLGGGLGTGAVYKDSPSHAIQGTTWPIAGDTGGATFTPPPQGQRVESFATEVLVAPAGTLPTPTQLVWKAPRPGTYLLESGTHPSIQGPMGLYGIVVVTTAPSAGAGGTAYPPGGAYPSGVGYAAEVPLLLSEIDPVQNVAVQAAVTTVGFSETSARVLRDTLSSVTVNAAGSGYASADTLTFGPAAACSALPSASMTLDPATGAILAVTVTSPGAGCTEVPTVTINTATGTGGSLTANLRLAGVMCSDGAAACYPPAVNYTPLYYLVNGTAFDKTNPGLSLFNAAAGWDPTGTTPVTSGIGGNVLVRIVNAGLRMHVPSVVGAQTGASGAAGLTLVAEDGNVLPGLPRVQSEVFMAAGKTVDVTVNTPTCTPVAPATTCTAPALPFFDRELSLSANSTARDGGMLAYIGVNGGGVPTTAASSGAMAYADTYDAVLPGKTLTISDPSKGVIANDVNVYGVRIVVGGVAQTGPVTGTNGVLSLEADGTFQYVAATTAPTSGQVDRFTYCGNRATSGNACTTLTLNAAAVEAASGITMANATYTANGTTLKVLPPGVLSVDSDAAGYPLTVVTSGTGAPAPSSGLTLSVDPTGGFSASIASCTPAAGSTVCPYTFTYFAQNAQGTVSSTSATVTIDFQPATNLAVTVLDGSDKKTAIGDYRWIIEEDRTFYNDPNCTQNPLPAGCPTATPQGTPAIFGTNFHTSYMPVVAQGCTGPLSCEAGQTLLGQAAVCDVGNGACRPDTTGQGLTATFPSQVHLDPTKRYYLSVLPGDAANPFNAAYAGAPDCSPTGVAAGMCGHGMGGAPIAKGQTSVMVLTEPSPYPPAKLTVFVFEDDYPLNGEHDAGGGVDVMSPQEPGLGGFEITLFDDAGGTGDATGQPTYDMFNMPLTNGLAGTIDPATGLDACPISPVVTSNVVANGITSGTLTSGTQGATVCSTTTPCTCTTQHPCTGDGTQKGIVGMIVTCPSYESDGKTLSPLAGQAVVPNLYQGRYGVVATPGADRIARGEEWLQTNTLDGQKAHDSFMRIGEPAYFQEYGPAGYHVTIGFANPKIINARRTPICTAAAAAGHPCTNELRGHVTTARMSRPPDERLYGSGSRDSYAFTQCYASLGDPDGADFAFVKCDEGGNFDFTGLPAGNWKLTLFDQWNDQIVDGISTPVGLGTATANCTTPASAGMTYCLDLGENAVHQWQANVYTRTFLDANGNGVSDKDASGNDLEAGLALVATNIRFRDGSFSNFNNTDLNGYAGFNEVFPLFSWYVLETDTTRFKTTGVHVVYDSGGPVDGTCTSSTAPCGSSSIGQHMANTYETYPLPANLSLPGAVYCPDGADCAADSIANGPVPSSTTNHTTGRIDPPFWFGSYGWQGFAGQNSFLEFGKRPYAPGETGGIHGHVVYASTRPFDDPQLLLQTSWEPLVPHVRVNLYKEDVGPDGVSTTLTLIDHTDTSSFDDWAQGFRRDASGNLVKDAQGNPIPNISCPGQSTTDLYYYSLQNQPQWLDLYANGSGNTTPLPYGSQYKCYDGMHNWNQVQPAPYDGMYSFPSVTAFDPVTGQPKGTNCTGCTTDPDATDRYRFGTPMLPAGKYVVEVVVPPGYELVKEEDKNILIGDNFIAPVAQQFGGLGNIFILPDQASVGAAYNPNNPQNPTANLGRIANLPSHEGDTGSVESYWPCVGAARVVPDYISLFPGSAEVAPFAGATRNLCDRKEITLTDQSAALAKFYIFTPTHVASHFTGLITDDFTSEFDPFSPQFGEKFAPANLPVSLKDWTGNEISRVYTDWFGAYNGLSYSTWEVNPPNPTGYGPTMMVVCMNDSGAGTPSPWWDPTATGPSTKPDPLFQAAYSQFCYELPFMPGQTGYFDTPVTPNSAFSEGFNHPDCNYPDATPAIKEVDGDGVGPWVSAGGHTLTVTALGDQLVDAYAYSGPSVTTSPFNQKKVTRHYGFGGTKGTVALVSPPNQATGATITVTLPAAGLTWTDRSITAILPSTLGSAFNCPVQQQAQYTGGTALTAQCAQLVITAANGKTSVDTVTVTIGGKAPTRLAAGQTIQSAVDAASPGDLIIVPAGTYDEMVLMWKPVRLQGVGAASAIIDANTQPAAKLLDPWRSKVNCLFGLSPDGRPRLTDTSCSTGWTATPSPAASYPTMIVDRVPMEGILGWDTTVNGNLAEQLIEPSLMGAYEGAAVTVLGKGVKIPAGAPDAWGSGAEAAFPAGTVLLTAADCATGPSGTNLYPSNYYCNPSSIDGLGMTDSSQGGGGIFVHGWGHFLQIANNRVYSNLGTLSGGITIGQGEHVDQPLVGDTTTIPPGSCESNVATLTNPANLALPFCYNMRVNVHHNAVTVNSSLGDELFSSTPAGAGGVSIANGADYYRFTQNWVCGNLSSGDGGGVAHIGWSKNGLIEHNAILFNQSTNPTISTNGGGLLVMGAPDPDPPCGLNTDKDCVPDPASIGPSDGTGRGLVVNANLILGNTAESGSGGGLRLQHVNGTDAVNFPNGQLYCATPATCLWNSVAVTNNIIANNVAGWDGAGVSLQDALAVNIINNTIISNDSTASAGVLFGSLFAPLASTPGTNCTVNNGAMSCPQVAGLVSVTNSPVLVANLPATGFSCPVLHGSTLLQAGTSCRSYSIPALYNDVIWQNRSFDIGVSPPPTTGTQNQQNVVTLLNAFTNTLAPSQSSTDGVTANGDGVIITGGTGACMPGVSYWDIGVRGDKTPSTHDSGFSLAPTWSFLTDAGDYAGANNSGSNPTVLTQYCNGSRVPPELGAMGYLVPPGTNETNALPTPVFTLTANATVDEGNNWINMRWGPLAKTHPVSGMTLANYGPATGSPVINYISLLNAPLAFALAPSTDFYGNPRKTNASVDAGAVEFVAAAVRPVLTGITPTSGARSSTVAVTLTGTGLTGATAVNMGGNIACAVTGSTDTTATASCAISGGAALSTRQVTVTTPNGTSAATAAVTFTVTGATLAFSGPTPALTTSTANTTTKNGTITVSNGGAATGAFTFTANPTVTQTTGGGTFSITGGTCTSGYVISPGSSCTVNVQYVPSGTATSTAYLTVTGTGLSTTNLNSPSFNAN